jgi:F-type H+-transporting ATPase subunit epsilon
MDSSSHRSLKCIVVTPERAVLDMSADFVALPMYDGELGVLPGRMPLIGRLGIGELRVRHGHETRHLFVDGGFAQVRADVVTVLTQSALAAEEIKPDAVVAEAQKARELPGRNPEDMAAKEKAEQRARVKGHLIGQPASGAAHGGH